MATSRKFASRTRSSPPVIIMSNSRALQTVLYATVIFLAGAVTGALMAPLLGPVLFRPPEPKQLSRHMFARLESGLHLTNDQRTQIKPLLEKTCVNMETIQRETTCRVLDCIAH